MKNGRGTVKGVVMMGNEGKIDVLCENYDGMTEEGKTELMMIGERYLRELNFLNDMKLIGKNEGLEVKNEN
jgi:hypothetical protein